MKRLLILLALLPTILMGQEVIKIGESDTIEYSGTLSGVIQVGKVYQLSLPTGKFLFLWNGAYDGNSLKNTVGVNDIYINNKNFTTTYIPDTSSSMFNIPNITSYKQADEDSLWVNNGSPANVTVDGLIGSDYTRTFVKYDNDSPYHVRSIGILKKGETLTTAEVDAAHRYFNLYMFWSDSLNIYGYYKQNRTISSPAVITAKVEEANKNKILITFNEYIDSLYTPDVSVFTVSGKTVTDVSIVDSIVTITVNSDYTCEDSVEISYTKPIANPLQTTGGTKIASFTDQHVYNYLTELYGPELINQSTWYTAAYWSAFGAGWAQDGTALVKTGAATFLRKDNIWQVGSVYKVKITIETVRAGTLNAPYNGGGTTHQYQTTGTYTYEHTCATNTNVYIYDFSWKGKITALSIKLVL